MDGSYLPAQNNTYRRSTQPYYGPQGPAVSGLPATFLLSSPASFPLAPSARDSLASTLGPLQFRFLKHSCSESLYNLILYFLKIYSNVTSPERPFSTISYISSKILKAYGCSQRGPTQTACYECNQGQRMIQGPSEKLKG